MATITIEQLTKVYPNGFKALDSLDLSIADGEFMVLVGPSGCGKTTALRMVAGLEEITSGTLRLGDRVMNDVPARDRDIAMVFQNYALYPHMTVEQNIGFALMLRRLPKAEIKRKVAATARILGLTSQLRLRPAQLSGGQRQRVAMGRAIVREPAAFLMDEPLSNLDAKLRVQMRAEVSRIQRRLGVATLYVTHDQTEAMTMGDRVAVLEGGVLQQCDSPQRVYDRPNNLFVAAFIGSPAMNLYSGHLAADGRSVMLGSQQLSLGSDLLVARPGLERHRGRELVVGIRPEHLSEAGGRRPSADEPAPGAGPAPGGGLPPGVGARLDGTDVLEGDVELVEALGSELLVHFRIDAPRVHSEVAEPSEVEEQERPRRRARRGGGGAGAGDGAAGDAGGEIDQASRDASIARFDPRTTVRPGDRMSFGVDTTRIHFFDSGTGNAILQ
ncbi:MAG TPA: ATP-binding cassette domain-containing protein [Acidimicrobiales bacterium]|nr:ATP-binding cassette domain-containing protein [Acidimicrobiales bacterium]